MAVPVRGVAGVIDVGAPVALFPARLATGATIVAGGYNSTAQYAVAPDGRILMNIAAAADAASSPITVVLNWAAELRK